jgi:hypothetical protein
MTLEELTRMNPAKIPDEQLGAMSHSDLMAWRQLMEKSGDKKANVRLAPFEHQAFAREYVKENPVSGTLGLSASIPLYQLVKSAGFMQNGGNATPPSIDQLLAGFRGIGQGLGLKK